VWCVGGRLRRGARDAWPDFQWTGEVVVIIGANGAGKTTTCGALADDRLHRRVEFPEVVARSRPRQCAAAGSRNVRKVAAQSSTHVEAEPEHTAVRTQGPLPCDDDIEAWYDRVPRASAVSEQQAGA